MAKLWRILLIGLLLIPASLAAVVSAQGPTGPVEVTATPAAGPAETTAAPVAGPPGITAAPSGQLVLTMAQLDYPAARLSGSDGDVTYRLNLPGNFNLSSSGNAVELHYSHFPPRPAGPAALNVSVNQQVLASLPLTDTNALSATTRIAIPDKLLKAGGQNSLTVHLDTGGTCETPAGPIEALVDPSSSLIITYQQQSYPADLALYPQPFSQASLLNIPTLFVLPDSPSPADLSAAATVAAGLGQASGGNVVVSAVRAADLTPEQRANAHLVVVGQPGTNPLIDELTLPLPLTSPDIKPGQGVLEEVVSPWNPYRLVLLVTGPDDAGLAKAGNALNRKANFLGMSGPAAVVVDLLPLSAQETNRTASTTLAALGYADDIAYGTKPAAFNYEFNLPLGWEGGDEPFFVLKYAFANILNPEQSIVDVKLNRVPIGSALLDPQAPKSGELSVTLPARLLREGRNRLEVGVSMAIPGAEGRCSGLDDQRAWTVISSDSELFLPVPQFKIRPDLAVLPFPFSGSAGFYDTVFVLPDAIASPSLDQLVRLAAHLGSSSRPEYVSLQVVKAGDVPANLRQGNHVIVLGRPTTNAVLADLNDRLPQPFVAGADLLQPLAVDKVAFLPDPRRDAGLLEILPSPWDEERTIMVVAGTTDRGVDLAVQAIIEQPRQLKGNLAVVEPTFDPTTGLPQISTYSLDTRSPAPADSKSQGSANRSQNDIGHLLDLAARWWK